VIIFFSFIFSYIFFFYDAILNDENEDLVETSSSTVTKVGKVTFEFTPEVVTSKI